MYSMFLFIKGDLGCSEKIWVTLQLGSISAAHSSSGILPEKRRLDAWAIDCVCDVNSKYNLCEVNSCGEIALDIPKTLILRKQKLHNNA